MRRVCFPRWAASPWLGYVMGGAAMARYIISLACVVQYCVWQHMCSDHIPLISTATGGYDDDPPRNRPLLSWSFWIVWPFVLIENLTALFVLRVRYPAAWKCDWVVYQVTSALALALDTAQQTDRTPGVHSKIIALGVLFTVLSAVQMFVRLASARAAYRTRGEPAFTSGAFAPEVAAVLCFLTMVASCVYMATWFPNLDDNTPLAIAEYAGLGSHTGMMVAFGFLQVQGEVCDLPDEDLEPSACAREPFAPLPAPVLVGPKESPRCPERAVA